MCDEPRRLLYLASADWWGYLSVYRIERKNTFYFIPTSIRFIPFAPNGRKPSTFLSRKWTSTRETSSSYMRYQRTCMYVCKHSPSPQSHRKRSQKGVHAQTIIQKHIGWFRTPNPALFLNPIQSIYLSTKPPHIHTTNPISSLLSSVNLPHSNNNLNI